MTIAFAILAGILCWSLVEYLLHRYLGHEINTRVRFRKEHLKHHFIENYFAPTKVKALVAFIVVAGITLTLTPLLGARLAVSFALSFTCFYLFYEFLHRSLHEHQFRSNWLRTLQSHHLHHHQRAVVGNYGVTSPLWDRVFGTYQSACLSGGSCGDESSHSKHKQRDRKFDEERGALP